MELASLEPWNFRNLAHHSLSLSDGVNLIVGGNGQGKTNLLEAVAVLGNLRSFRTSRSRSLVRHGEVAFRLTGTVNTPSGEMVLQQVVEIGPPVQRTLTINGAEVVMAEYLGAFPVFALAPSDRDLVVGGPEVRRAFADRLAFLLKPDHLRSLRWYNRCLKQRNAALGRNADDDQLEGWERQLAEYGARVCRNRVEAVRAVAEAFSLVYSAIGHGDRPSVKVSYRGEPETDLVKELEQTYFERYNENRARDRGVGYTIDGPHRHDVALRVEGRSVRDVLSSGQAKIVAAALRLASLLVVETARDTVLPLIIDDIDAELDKEAVERLMTWVGGSRQTSLSSVNERLEGLHSQGSENRVDRRAHVIRMNDGHGQVEAHPGGSS